MIRTTRKPSPKPDPVRDAAQAALDKAEGDVQAAAKVLERAVREDARLRELLTEPLIAGACYDAVRAISHRERRAIWQPPQEKRVKTRVEGARRVVMLAAGNLMAFPLPGGKKLAEATRADVAKARDFYASQSADMGEKARWLELILQSIPAGKKVGEALTDKRLRELQTEAQRDG